MLVGFSAGLKGINEINTPASWPETYEKIEKYPLPKKLLLFSETQKVIKHLFQH